MTDSDSQLTVSHAKRREAVAMTVISVVVSLVGILMAADWFQGNANRRLESSLRAGCHVGGSSRATACRMMRRVADVGIRAPGWNEPLSASLYGKCCGCRLAPAASAAIASRLAVLASGWTLAPPDAIKFDFPGLFVALRWLRFASANPRAPPAAFR
jgi:hypothetical protein